MSLDQTLNKLQNIIHETLPELELFVDGTIQPSSTDCENLQKQLTALQEQLNIFKYLKTHKEISPSFGLHAKVSEAVTPKTDPIVEEVLKQDGTITPNSSAFEKEIESLKTESSVNTSQGKKLEVTLNQKFQFINELFNQNAKEYGLAIDQINDCSNWQDAESYLLSLKSAYSWKDSNDNFKRLTELCKKRFE
jgi:hypothetical protein